jgi:hypothetical protein
MAPKKNSTPKAEKTTEILDLTIQKPKHPIFDILPVMREIEEANKRREERNESLRTKPEDKRCSNEQCKSVVTFANWRGLCPYCFLMATNLASCISCGDKIGTTIGDEEMMCAKCHDGISQDINNINLLKKRYGKAPLLADLPIYRETCNN